MTNEGLKEFENRWSGPLVQPAPLRKATEGQGQIAAGWERAGTQNAYPAFMTGKRRTFKMRPKGQNPRSACARHEVDGYADTGTNGEPLIHRKRYPFPSRGRPRTSPPDNDVRMLKNCKA